MKDKRDNKQLTPGSLYRITDYNCTTTQENTQSAGHQFDIVLLALSENKLAEEGWAMQHANDTYFANSNLSAWKVWYCLDNDTARFAWAEKDVPTFTCNINVPSAGWSFENVRVIRDYGADYDGRYAYVVINGDTVTNIATDRELKDSGDYTIYLSVHVSANAHVEILSSSVTANGTGVIYRLIDEFNNDVGYDFKNIQFLVKIDMKTGYYDRGGDDTYVYSLNAWIDGVIMDASIIGNTLQNDVGIIDMVANNVIKTESPVEDNAKGYYLPFNVVLTSNEDGDGYYGVNDVNFSNYSNHNIVTSPCRAIHFNGICSENVIFPNVYVTFINCANMTEQNSYSGLYLNNKKVLTEE